MPRRKDETVEEPAVAVVDKPRPKPKAITAIFHPDGNIRVNLTAPSGREYHIEPREPFEIAGEDIDWFFYKWDWSHRQRLTRAEEYVPPTGYFDGTLYGAAAKTPGSGVYRDLMPAGTPKTPGSGEYFDATPGTASVITAEERETRELGAQPETTAEVEAEEVKEQDDGP